MRAYERQGHRPGRRPTILQIVPRLDTGGAELTTIEITEAVVAAGGRALVVTEGGRMAAEVGRRGGELIEMPASSKSPLVMVANARRIAELIRREDVDLVHARSRAPAWSALRAARTTGRSFVTTYHGAYNETNAAKRLYNSVMARGDRVIANSNYTAGIIKSRYGTCVSRVRVIHRGVDVRTFDPAIISAERVAALRAHWGLKPGQRALLQAARLTEWKGQSTVIEAAARLARDVLLADTVIVLAGDAQGRTGYRDGLVQQIVALGLGDRVRLVGHCDDMPAAYVVASAAVVASTEPEAFGRTAAEAQAMGCPVIATAIGAPPETVLATPHVPPESATGWLVPPGDAEALAACLSEALGLSQAARARMSARARAHALHNFSLAAMQRATLAVYDELLGSDLSLVFAGASAINTPATERTDEA